MRSSEQELTIGTRMLLHATFRISSSEVIQWLIAGLLHYGRFLQESYSRAVMERADVLWRALKAYRESKTNFSDAVIVELGSDAGCSKTVTFDRQAGTHPGFEALR